MIDKTHTTKQQEEIAMKCKKLSIRWVSVMAMPGSMVGAEPLMKTIRQIKMLVW